MVIGELEEKIMLAILKENNDAYGAVIREVLATAGRDVSVGALYITLDRLVEKGLLEARDGQVSTSKGGKARRFFCVNGKGYDLLKANEKVRSNLGSLVKGLSI
jgi:PadR family transcriptional regulator PadR